MAITTIFFDLDNTLYSSDNGIWATIGFRINDYMQERLNIPPDEIPTLRRTYYRNYGTTLRGLQIHYDIDADDFLAYVHNLPIDLLIQPDPELIEMLFSLPQRKFIFTNSNIEYAERVLSKLDISDCFEKIIDIRAMNFQCKPNPQAYHIALKLAGEIEPRSCMYLDDSIRNLSPALEMGFYTILIGTTDIHSEACHSIKRPHDLRQILPALWAF